MREHHTEVLIVGGGLGGVAAARAVARLGHRAILTEESPWLGGQLTSQAVPPDENAWIEHGGASRSYLEFRERIRSYYRRNYPLSDMAQTAPLLNPGLGRVSRLCHEPRVALAAIDELLAPHRSAGSVIVLMEHEPTACSTDGDRVDAVSFRRRDGEEITVSADFVLDATELGDLLELAGVEHVTGSESQADTGELHARTDRAEPCDQQSFTWCLAIDHVPGSDFTIDKPDQYERWASYHPGFWPGPQLAWGDVSPISLKTREYRLFRDDETGRGGEHAGTWWPFRRIAAVPVFRSGTLISDITIVNWPHIDYWRGPLVGVDDASRAQHVEAARQLSLSFLYWLQTAAPRHDGGCGYPGIRPRGDLLGTDDGLAMRPYIRESRRIKAEFTVLEQHVGIEARERDGLPPEAEQFADSVGIGHYRIDLHPSCGGPEGPRTYVDVASYPFQIPLGALLPQRMTNLLPAAKNIGTTHITNGCYRMHPVEWNIGEVAGALAAHCLSNHLTPHQVRADPRQLAQFQHLLAATLGVRLAWPKRALTAMATTH